MVSKITELKLKYYIYIQSKSLKNILFNSQWFIFWILFFNGLLFMFCGREGYHSSALWFICIACVINLFRNAINASEVGL